MTITLRSQWLRRLLLLGAVGCAIAAGAAVLWWTRPPLLQVEHAPKTFARRAGALSANICGTAFPWAALRYRINDAEWQPVLAAAPRTPAPRWTIELLREQLLPGENRLQIEATAFGRATVARSLRLNYDDSPVRLPLLQDWSGPLDVQDGRWEVVEVDGERRVRPALGAEGYDRLLLVCGAVRGGRRVETEITLRAFSPWQTWAGFGVLTMWGGHLDDGHRPRRGWRYAIAWWMKPYGPWCEFSNKHGDAPRHDSFSGETLPEPEPGSRWSLIAECWPERDAGGRHLRHRQRMKIWPTGTPEPAAWLETTDKGAAELPPAEYAVALIAHECSAEFGPVRITALPAATLPAPR